MKFTLSAAFTAVTALPRIAVAADEAGLGDDHDLDHVVNPKELKTPIPTPRRRIAALAREDRLAGSAGDDGCARHDHEADPVHHQRLRAADAQPLSWSPRRSRPSRCCRTTAAVLTVGVGWSRDEFEILGEDFSTRGKRTDEMIEIMRLLCDRRLCRISWQALRLPPVEMNPKPAWHILIWSGGISEAALKRAARVTEEAGCRICSERPISSPRSSGSRSCARTMAARMRRSTCSPSLMDVLDVDGYRRLEDEGVTHILMQPRTVYHPGDAGRRRDGRFTSSMLRR